MSKDRALDFSIGGDGAALFAPDNELAEFLRSAVSQAVRERSSCGLLLVAVDGLDRIEQRHGANIAGQVVGTVVERLRTRMRGGDRLARFSADTFVLVLNNCSPNDLAQAAARFLAAVHDEAIETSAGQISVTVTIGGVTSPRPAGTVDEALQRAQAALDAATAERPGSLQICRPIERDRHMRPVRRIDAGPRV